jgi:transposase
MGWFQQVHAKSIGSQEIRGLPVARKQLLGRLLDVELSIRGILRGFGLKVRPGDSADLGIGDRSYPLERIAEAMLSARATLKAQYEKLPKAVLAIVREDAICQRLMTVPGVGPVVAVMLGETVLKGRWRQVIRCGQEVCGPPTFRAQFKSWDAACSLSRSSTVSSNPSLC